jgi:hypothetical protein
MLPAGYSQIDQQYYGFFIYTKDGISIQYPSIWHPVSFYGGVTFEDSLVLMAIAQGGQAGDLKTIIQQQLQDPTTATYKVNGITDTSVNGKSAVAFDYDFYAAIPSYEGTYDPNQQNIIHMY